MKVRLVKMRFFVMKTIGGNKTFKQSWEETLLSGFLIVLTNFKTFLFRIFWLIKPFNHKNSFLTGHEKNVNSGNSLYTRFTRKQGKFHCLAGNYLRKEV